MRAIDIEALVRWAYRDELPKAASVAGEGLAFGFRSGWGGVERYGELLAVVQEPDIRNRYGLVPDFTATGEPHPDAVAVHEAVEALATLEFVQPEGWNPLSDMGDLGIDGPAAVARGLARLLVVEDARGADVALSRDLRSAAVKDGVARGQRLVLRRSPARLVIRQAILGGCPPWEAEAPERCVVMEYGKPKWFRRVVQVSDGAFGPASHEMEVDGFDAKRRRPFPDAYQRFILDPDPADAVHARAEYEIWIAALGVLVEDLAGQLHAHAPTPPTRATRPWERDVNAGRILPSLRPLAVESQERRAPRRKKKREAA